MTVEIDTMFPVLLAQEWSVWSSGIIRSVFQRHVADYEFESCWYHHFFARINGETAGNGLVISAILIGTVTVYNVKHIT